MDRPMHSENNNVKRQQPWPSPEVDIDIDIHFKPITEGLGFHQRQAEEKKIIKSGSISQKYSNQLRPAYKGHMAEPTKQSEELHHFYTTESAATTVQKNLLQQEEQKSGTDILLDKAHDLERLFAWFMDLAMISSLTFAVMALASFPSILKAEEGIFPMLSHVDRSEFFLLFIPIFVCFYLFYFTVSERSLGVSLGKKWMSLKVIYQGEGKGLSPYFMRSLLTLLSFVFLGLPAALKLQDSLTNTLVVKDENF